MRVHLEAPPPHFIDRETEAQILYGSSRLVSGSTVEGRTGLPSQGLAPNQGWVDVDGSGQPQGASQGGAVGVQQAIGSGGHRDSGMMDAGPSLLWSPGRE